MVPYTGVCLGALTLGRSLPQLSPAVLWWWLLCYALEPSACTKPQLEAVVFGSIQPETWGRNVSWRAR